MIPLSKLRKEHQNKATVGVATDSADTACACDAAPKKPQTLQQHLKQYHGGKMPTGDCKFLKQYKKDHPDWKSEVPKPSKGESDIDTVKKDAKPKKGAWDYSVEDINSDDIETAKGALAKFIAERNMRMAPASYKKQSEKDAELKKVRDEIEKTAKGETGDATWYAQCLAAYHTRGMKEMADPYKMPLIKAMQEAEKKTGNTHEAKMDALRKNIEARKAKEGKKDDAPKGADKLKGTADEVLRRFGVKEEDIPEDVGARVAMINKLTKYDEYRKGQKERDKKRIATAQKQFPSPKLVTRSASGFNDDGTYNHEKDIYGFGDGKDYVEFTGKELDDLAKKGKGAKKSAAEEYVDSVKKDAKKSDTSAPFDLDKAQDAIWKEVSKQDSVKNMDLDIFGDGNLTLAFDMANGGTFGKGAQELLANALGKLGIPKEDIGEPKQSGTRAIVVAKLDALRKQNDDDDIESAESLIDNNSEDDLEAMFSDDSRKTCVDGARKQAAKTGDSYDVTWSPNTGWGFIKHYKGNLSKGQTVLGTVSNDFDDKGVRMGAQFHRNMDFDSKKPVERYKEIQAALDARKTALAKGESDNGDSGKGGSAEPVEYPKVVMDAVEKERAKAPVDDTDWTDEEADKFVELTDGIYQQDFDNTEVETHKGFAIVWNKMGAWRVELDKGKVTDLC